MHTHRTSARLSLRAALALLAAALAAAIVSFTLLRLKPKPETPGPAATPAGNRELLDKMRRLEAEFRQSPSDDTRLALAEAYLEAGYTDDALRFINDVAPDRPETALFRGMALVSQGDMLRAEEQLKQAREGMPDSARPGIELTRLYSGTGRNDEAIRTALATANAHPEEYDALVTAAQLLVDTRRYHSETTRLLQQAMDLDPERAEAYALMALWSGVRVDEALEYAQKALDRDPNNFEALVALAWLLMQQEVSADNIRRAESALLRATALEPDNHLPHLRLGQVYRHADRLDEAAEQLETAVNMVPWDSRARFALADVYDRLGRCDEARELRTSAKFQADYDEGEASLRLLVRDNPNDPDVYARLAEFYLQYGKRNAASLVAQQALEIDPEHAKARSILDDARGGRTP